MDDEFYDWLGERLGDEDMTYARGVLDEYDRGNREYRESSEARINEYAASEATMREDIQSLKARNYDLLMQVPAEPSPGDGGIVNMVDDDGSVYHIDDLFRTPDQQQTDQGRSGFNGR